MADSWRWTLAYDLALTTDSDLDVDDEGVWNIVRDREERRKMAELKRLGNMQVLRYLEEKKSNTQAYEARLYYKYAYPLASLVMVLIAVPFSFLMGNRGTLFGIGAAIGISMAFWFAFAMFSALGTAALLPPFISAFAPVFIFTAASVYLFINIKT